MRRAIITGGLCLTLLAGTAAHAAPKAKNSLAAKANAARTAAITEIQVTEYGMQGPHDSGSNAITWRLWPDRVNSYRPEYNWDGSEMRDPRSPVNAAAIAQGDFSGLVRYLQSSPLIGKLTAQGAKGRPGGGPAGDELQIIVVRGGKREGVFVPGVGGIDANSSATEVAAWTVSHLVQSITATDNWGEVVGGRVDTGLQATFDGSVVNLPENERPVFSVLNAAGKEVATLRDNFGDAPFGASANGSGGYVSSIFLLPGSYRLVKKETTPAGAGAKSKAYDWVADLSTHVIKAGAFAPVRIFDRLQGVEKLLAATEADKVEEVRALLERGLPANARSDGGETLLMVATRKGNLASARLLLDKGAQIDARTPDGLTALMLAMQYGKAEMVSLLIEKGADVNAQDDNGDTVLRMTARSGQAEIARLLIEKGAPVNDRDENGVSALMKAVEYKPVPAFEGPPFDEALEVAMARLLIEKGALVNAQDKDGKTPLMMAAQYGKSDAVRLLIAKGAQVNAQTKDGQTALMLAAGFGWAQVDLVQFLIEKGAPVNARAKDGNTALMMAAQSGTPEVVSLLLSRKADATLKNKSGKTALALATNEATKKLLRAAGAR